LSHIVKCKVEMKNTGALTKAIDHLKLNNLGRGSHKLFGGQVADGIAVKLEGWSYPVVINTETGEAKYDNYGGSWGKQVELDKLVQRYAVEVTREQALLSGFSVEEQLQANGNINLVMTEVVSC
jgi:hypothetical protein